MTLFYLFESEFSLQLQGRPKRLIRSEVVAIYVYRGVRMVCDKSSIPDVYGNTLLSRQVSDIQAI